jgi:hypothetical protein
MEHICEKSAQILKKNSDASIQHISANVAENLEPCRDEPTILVSRREPSPHPKQRRTPTAMLQAKAPAVTQTDTDHEVQPEMARSSKKRRVFIRRSELLTYARREHSNCRSTSLLSNIIAQSSAVSPILDSSMRVESKTSGFSSSDPNRQQKEASGVRHASNSPRSNSPVPNSTRKTPSKVVNKLSPTFSPLNPSKASSRSLSKPSIARGLLELDPENTLSSRQRKDSRRKDMASVSILFSHHLDEDVVKRLKKVTVFLCCYILAFNHSVCGIFVMLYVVDLGTLRSPRSIFCFGCNTFCVGWFFPYKEYARGNSPWQTGSDINVA